MSQSNASASSVKSPLLSPPVLTIQINGVEYGLKAVGTLTFILSKRAGFFASGPSVDYYHVRGNLSGSPTCDCSESQPCRHVLALQTVGLLSQRQGLRSAHEHRHDPDFVPEDDELRWDYEYSGQAFPDDEVVSIV